MLIDQYRDAIRYAREMVEMEYVRALGRGVLDPVVTLMTLPRDETSVGVGAAREREEVAAEVETLDAGAAAGIRHIPPGPRRMTVVFSTSRGFAVVHEHAPEG